MHVKFVTPDRILFDSEAESVLVPGSAGQFEILQNHAPIISSLDLGQVVIKGKENLDVTIVGGFVEVADNNVSICAEVEHQ